MPSRCGDRVERGGGFRYLTAREFGLQMGFDVARGPEEWAIYVVFGTPVLTQSR